jgi:ribosomal protein S14
MPRYIKIYLDDKRRKQYSEKKSRARKLTNYLSSTINNGQIRLFTSYCQSTTASQSVYSQFALSRHSLRRFANCGLICGVTASSW